MYEIRGSSRNAWGTAVPGTKSVRQGEAANDRIAGEKGAES